MAQEDDELVGYHGTLKPGFTEFNTDPAKNKSHQQLMLGAHFSETPELAEEYAIGTPAATKHPKPGGGVYKMRLQLKNPLDLTSPTPIYPGDPRWEMYQSILPLISARTMSKLRLKMWEGEGSTQDGFPQDGPFIVTRALENALEALPPEKARAIVEQHGYDGIIYHAMYGGSPDRAKPYKSYVVFNKEQLSPGFGAKRLI